MDSFTTVAIEDITVTTGPVDKDGGGGSTSYCVVTKIEDVDGPVNKDGGGGSTSYCVVA